MPTGKSQIPQVDSGFTYMGLLMVMAVASIGIAGVGVVWHQDIQREREKELLYVGQQYRYAIGSYYEQTPALVKQYPEKLEDLLLDKRFPIIKRHLRRLYQDPMKHRSTWGLMLSDNKIIGVYSRSTLSPIKKDGFLAAFEGFADAQTYQDWKFVYIPGSIAFSPIVPAGQPLATGLEPPTR